MKEKDDKDLVKDVLAKLNLPENTPIKQFVVDMKEKAEQIEKERIKCPWCKSLNVTGRNHNGIFGPGGAYEFYSCNNCGRII